MGLECGDTQSHLLAALQRPSFVGSIDLLK
jgi:hypothetical protein